VVVVNFPMGTGVQRRGAVLVGVFAAHVLKLHGSVTDLEALVQNLVDLPEDRVAGGRRHVLDQDVAAQGSRFRSKIPNVKVVNLEHAAHLAEGLGHVPEP
jgi:hypothetical protein